MKERADHKTRFQSQGEGIPAGTKPICAAFPPEVDATLRTLPNRSVKIRQWVKQGMALEQGLPPLLADRLSQMLDRSQYLQEALVLFMQLSGKTIAKLDAVGDRAKAIEQAIALIEEHGLMDKLMERMNESDED